jgi:hypothetical protein
MQTVAYQKQVIDTDVLNGLVQNIIMSLVQDF